MATSIQKRRRPRPWGFPNNRKVQPIAPTSVAGLALWFDGADSVVQAAGSISQLTDKSTNLNHAIQATALNQATVQVAAQNGLNTVRFTAANSQAYNLTHPVTLPQCTTIAVVRRAGPTGANLIELLGNSTDINVYQVEWWSDLFLYGVDGANGFFSGLAFAQQDYNLITWVSGGTPATDAIFFNGSDVTARGQPPNPYVSAMTFDQIGHGDNAFMNGELATFATFNSILPDASRQGVEAYFKLKWATP